MQCLELLEPGEGYFSWYFLMVHLVLLIRRIAFLYDKERETWALSRNFSSRQQLWLLWVLKEYDLFTCCSEKRFCNSYQIAKGHPYSDKTDEGNLHGLCVQTMSTHLTVWILFSIESGQTAIFIYYWCTCQNPIIKKTQIDCLVNPSIW